MSTRTSGIYANTYEDTRYCQIESVEGVDCTFYGKVEVSFDPEIFTQWWKCPLCGHEHDEGYEEEDYE